MKIIETTNNLNIEPPTTFTLVVLLHVVVVSIHKETMLSLNVTAVCFTTITQYTSGAETMYRINVQTKCHNGCSIRMQTIS